MRFSLSTNWNARRHRDGRELVDEILGLGFDAIEIGYHTTDELAEGILARIKAGDVAADSVHSTCPVPIGAPQGYPELYLMTSPDEDERGMGRIMLLNTLKFAQKAGAKAVVLHAGRIQLRSRFFLKACGRELFDIYRAEGDDAESPRYLRALARFRQMRARALPAAMGRFCESLDKLLPAFEAAKVTLCLENLPSIEAFPDPDEMLELHKRYLTPSLAYWHDIGHGQVREFMGWEGHVETSKRLLPVTRGIHIHDAAPPDNDHLAIGQGAVDFPALRYYAADSVIKVFEPGPDVTAEALAKSLSKLRRIWAS